VNDSLSLIVLVRNAEATLAQQIQHLLDLVPDFTSRFEILVVDDGSTDHTFELAADLSRQYPQLRIIRHFQTRGIEAARTTGLRHASGQTVMVQEDSGLPSPTQLRRLWSLRHDRDLIMARSQQRPRVFDADLLERLTTWGQTLRNLGSRTSAGGVQMIRRDAAHDVSDAAAEQTLHVYELRESDLRVPVVREAYQRSPG
jgi:glycosyltransferase involved in cell wall biosynthesis